MVGKNQGSVIGTLVERQTRLIRLMHLPTRDADALRIVITDAVGHLPVTLIRSITWDQGIEMARHTAITATSVRRSTSAIPARRGSEAATKTPTGPATVILPERHHPQRLHRRSFAGSRALNQQPPQKCCRRPKPRPTFPRPLCRYRYESRGLLDCCGVDVAAVVQPG